MFDEGMRLLGEGGRDVAIDRNVMGKWLQIEDATAVLEAFAARELGDFLSQSLIRSISEPILQSISNRAQGGFGVLVPSQPSSSSTLSNRQSNNNLKLNLNLNLNNLNNNNNNNNNSKRDPTPRNDDSDSTCASARDNDDDNAAIEDTDDDEEFEVVPTWNSCASLYVLHFHPTRVAVQAFLVNDSGTPTNQVSLHNMSNDLLMIMMMMVGGGSCWIGRNSFHHLCQISTDPELLAFYLQLCLQISQQAQRLGITPLDYIIQQSPSNGYRQSSDSIDASSSGNSGSSGGSGNTSGGLPRSNSIHNSMEEKLENDEKDGDRELDYDTDADELSMAPSTKSALGPIRGECPESFLKLLNVVDHRNWTPLGVLLAHPSSVAEHPMLQCVKLLTHYRAKIDSSCEWLECRADNILHKATAWPSVLRFLLDSKAELRRYLGTYDALTGFTPLQTFCANGHRFSQRALDKMVALGADIEQPTQRMQITALMLACRRGNVRFVRALVQRFHASLSARDNKGRTVLHYACLCPEKSVYELVTFLLQALHERSPPPLPASAPPPLPPSSQHTEGDDDEALVPVAPTASEAALSSAEDVYDHAYESESEAMIIDDKALLNVPDRAGCFPLEIACNTQRPRLARMLLLAGSEPANLHALLLPFARPRYQLIKHVFSLIAGGTVLDMSSNRVAFPLPHDKPEQWWQQPILNTPGDYYHDVLNENRRHLQHHQQHHHHLQHPHHHNNHGNHHHHHQHQHNHQPPQKAKSASGKRSQHSPSAAPSSARRRSVVSESVKRVPSDSPPLGRKLRSTSSKELSMSVSLANPVLSPRIGGQVSETIAWIGLMWGTERHLSMLNNEAASPDLELTLDDGHVVKCHRVRTLSLSLSLAFCRARCDTDAKLSA